MFTKFAVALFVVVAVTSNPAANQPWRWIHRRIYVSPNMKAAPFDTIVQSIFPQSPKYPSGTVKVEGCGTAPLAPTSDSKIVGGNEASPHAYPWQVALYIDDIYFCGGSIISEEWIMTAAHCMKDAGKVEVVAGAHDLSQNEPSQVSMFSKDFFIHENYNSAIIHNDIAMIRLPTTLSFNNYIQPVCLPSGSDLGVGVLVNPSGWGKDHDGFGGITDTLREVTVPTISNEQCAAYYGNLIITDGMICIDATAGKGTCNGDSGGPLNYKTGGITESRGIVSFGSTAGCEVGIPDSFTRVNHYLGWIQDNTGVTI